MKKAFRNSECYREIPTMTRSQYIEEYTEITEWTEKERKTVKKYIPITGVVTGIWILVLFIAWLNGVDVIWYSWIYHLNYGTEAALFLLIIPLIPAFPFIAIAIRLKQIKKHEQKRLDALEERKTLCISMGTYKAEE